MPNAFEIVDQPTSTRASRSQWATLIEAVKGLPAGKAIKVPLNGHKPESLRNSISLQGKNNGVKVRTSLTDGQLFVWKDEGNAEDGSK